MTLQHNDLIDKNTKNITEKILLQIKHKQETKHLFSD